MQPRELLNISHRRQGFILAGVLFVSLILLPDRTAAKIEPLKYEGSGRKVDFTYLVTIELDKAAKAPVDIFLPLASSNEKQEVLRQTVRANGIPGIIKTDAKYGNRFWHGRLEKPGGTSSIQISVDYTVKRDVFRHPLQLSGVSAKVYSRGELAQWQAFLEPNRLTPTSGPFIDRVRKDLPQGGKTPLERARIIYDFVIDNMTYKKTGKGWGNGSTEWACSKKYGNCTDFHALFISLARAEGIPARFGIGFPIPEDKAAGKISGYHCWVDFYLPSAGWFPIDASEAWKNPKRRDLYFGTQPADRVAFTVGRDLRLGDAHKSEPLNYFIYPHLEVGGKPYDRWQASFAFKDKT